MTLLYAWAGGAILVFLVLAVEELRGAATSVDDRLGPWVWGLITVIAVTWPLWVIVAIGAAAFVVWARCSMPAKPKGARP